MGKVTLRHKRNVNREMWMRAFETEVLRALPSQQGKIEWDSAVYFYNEGIPANIAAARYVWLTSGP